MEHICAASWLKLKGIQRIFKLDPHNAITRSSCDQVQLYMIRSDLTTFTRVIDQIKLICKSQTSEDSNLKYFHIICLPSCYAYFPQLLEQQGLYGMVGLHRYNWDFIHLDEGVLSMEMPNVFSTAFVNSDCSLTPSIAHSLRVLQILCGRPDFVLTYGEHSENIMKMVNKLGPLPKRLSVEDQDSDFSALLIVDRDKDYASPLLTPAIYAALLLEVFPKNAGVLDLEMTANRIKQQKLSILMIPDKEETQKNFKNKNNNTTIEHKNTHNTFEFAA